MHSVVTLRIGHEGLPRLGHLLVSELLRHLAAVANLVANLPAVMTGDDHLLPKLGVHVRRGWEFKPWVSIRTAGPSRAEPSKIIYTQNSSYMAVTTVRSMATESTIIPWTVTNLGLRINMKERTFFIVTSIES